MKKLNVQALIDDLRPRLPAGMLGNLWRAQQAVSLLAAITHEHAHNARIDAGQTSALASYISDDMDSMLNDLDRCEEY